jgi:DNA-binding SARP family transcriptional activator/tetratricopeptide (TPR) repeat protein
MIYVHTLGTALIDAGKTRVTPNSARTFALLLHLSAESGRRVSRVVLRDLLFPKQNEKNARHSLRELVYQLRQRGVDLDADSDGVLLPAESVRSDYAEIVQNGLSDAQRLKAIESGFLPGYAPTHSEAYTEWLEGYRARAMFELCKTLLKEISRARGGGDWMMTERAARACLALDPLNEEATLALAEILAVGGAKAQALGLLDRYLEEVGPRARGVTLPVGVLRRRISERLPGTCPASIDFPLVGRQSEMVLLNERLELAKAGESQCVVLHGEPGIGKSRLAAECCSWAILAGWRVERAAVQPHDRERPMAAFVELVPGVLKLPGALGAAPESLIALKRLTKHELHDASIDVESTHTSDAVAAAIVRAINDVADAVASEAPLILLIEDVQWLDAESLRTLAGLVSPSRGRRLLILLTSRERDSVRYFARHAGRLASIEIGQLPAECCTALVHQAIGEGGSKSDQSLREWLVSASGGNPFFLHSLVRHYQTTGQEFAISPTINALLDHRLATLSAGAMTVLWTAVALGNHSTIDRLVAALEMPHLEMVTSVRELEAARLIVQTGALVTAAHWLISDAVHRKATAIADKLGHRRIAAILEAEARANNDADKLWECAQHWLAADDASRAIEMIIRCSQHSIEIGRLREAAELLLKASSLATNPERNTFACKAITIAQSVAEFDVVDRAAKMVDHSNRTGIHDDIELAMLSAKCFLFGQNEKARAHLHDCVMATHADRDHRINAARALLVVADLWGGMSLSKEAFHAARSLIALNDQSNDPVALKFLLLYHATVGDTRECAELSHRLIGIARDMHAGIAGDLHRYAAAGLWRGGEFSEALENFKRAFELAESLGLRRAQFISAISLASFTDDIGQKRESRRWMDKAEQIADELPSLRTEPGYVSICFEHALPKRDVGELKRLLDLATRYPERTGQEQSRMARALDICIRQLSGTFVDPHDAIHDLMDHHLTDGESGNMGDLEVALAATLFIDAQEPDAARSAVRDYLLNYRRGGAAISAMLSDVIRRLDITELPPWC